jgi:DUF971 family protein
MRPLNLQQVGNELAVKWDDGKETFIPLEELRRACPCAGCQGEVDVLGNLHKGPDQILSPKAFELVKVAIVGAYGIQPQWADGHASGIYTFEYLRKVTREQW